MELRDRESIPVLGGFLGCIALLAALLLAFFSQITAKPITEARERTRQAVFHRLSLPEFDSAGKAVSKNEVLFYPVLKEKKICGYVGQGSSSGYGGKITVLAGFDVAGKITGVQILEHKETPGLGANVCDRKFQRTIFNIAKPQAAGLPPNAVLDQFNGRSAANTKNWKVSKDGGPFIFKTGATVTSRAVSALVESIALEFPAAQKLLNSGESK